MRWASRRVLWSWSSALRSRSCLEISVLVMAFPFTGTDQMGTNPAISTDSAPVHVPEIRRAELGAVGLGGRAAVGLAAVVGGESDVVVPGDLQRVTRSHKKSEPAGGIGGRAVVDDDARRPGAAAHEETLLGREPGDRGQEVVDLHVRIAAGDLASLRDERPAESDEQARAQGDPRVDDIPGDARRLVGRTLQGVVETDRLSVQLEFRAESRPEAGADIPVRPWGIGLIRFGCCGCVSESGDCAGQTADSGNAAERVHGLSP